MKLRTPTSIEGLLIGIIIIAFVFIGMSFHNSTENQKLIESLMNKSDSTSTELMQRIDLMNAGISRDVTRKYQIDGVEKYIASVNKKLKHDKRFTIATLIVNAAERHSNLSVSLITSVIKRESHFNNNLVSTAGAAGLMGIMEDTGEWGCDKMGLHYTKKKIKNPEVNIRIGSWYLDHLISKYGSTTLALAHYNGGYRQKNRYIHNRKFKNKPEFKQSKESIQAKVETLRDSLVSNGVGEGYLLENKEYAYLKRLLSAKKFSPETKHYIPAIMTEKEHIELFIKNNMEVTEAKLDSSKSSKS